MKKLTNIKPTSDYILIEPDTPQGGGFTVSDIYIDEIGIIKDVGEGVSENTRKLKGKKVIFNAWACDQKTVEGKKYYFATDSANAICGVF